MTIVLDGQNLTVGKLVQIARDGARVELHPDAVERINTCRRMLEEKVSAHETVYGVNTSIGEFAEVVLSAEMLNKGVTPVVCQKGSVGASGDLAPMPQIALLMMGEGEILEAVEKAVGSLE